MFPSLFWLILGIVNFGCAVMPPYSGFSLFNLVMSVVCFYFFTEARKRENVEDE